ncbi:MAG: hypothetical protein NC548_55490 [Lachnospiraceae bacterium]|nr:hypothetical protein [Lachnospiraceae bacterium]
MMEKLNRTEELDFHYLLGLMQPLHGIKDFAWLPELFSIIGHESLIKLCKYAGGETIRIPTLFQLSDSIDALQFYYDVYIKKTLPISAIPDNISSLVAKIKEVYDNAQEG